MRDMGNATDEYMAIIGQVADDLQVSDALYAIDSAGKAAMS